MPHERQRAPSRAPSANDLSPHSVPAESVGGWRLDAAIVTVHEILARLERVKTSEKGAMARCPAHDDARASLSTAEGDDGRVLLHCFAGCAAEAEARNRAGLDK